MENCKQITVPFIEKIENKLSEQFQEIMEQKASRFDVNITNWPESFPYSPICSGRIARSKDFLAISFHVYGLDLRAYSLSDNGTQWEDSCCEFFVEDPQKDKYYNFEINCAGYILAAMGASRDNREKRPAEMLSSIKRDSSIVTEKIIDIKGGSHSWDISMLIPFELIGVDKDNLPEKLRANFYKCADKTANPHFLSWNPIKTENPDFHRPEFFGELLLK